MKLFLLSLSVFLSSQYVTAASSLEAHWGQYKTAGAACYLYVNNTEANKGIPVDPSICTTANPSLSYFSWRCSALGVLNCYQTAKLAIGSELVVCQKILGETGACFQPANPSNCGSPSDITCD